jgi:hypothetical protein
MHSRLTLLLLIFAISACSGNGIEQQADRYGFATELIAGEGFLHRVVVKAGQGQVTHVYIEGDGRPWLHQRQIAKDPTAEKLLMLELMSEDPASAIYLGRPCYFDARSANCSPRWWTDKRYAQEVVVSMNAALDRVIAPNRQLVIFGHSGGGSLAMLLAARRDDVLAVVTLAANLDIALWAETHRYTPLTESLNPAQQEPLPASLLQHHYLGEDDSQVTVGMIVPTVARQTRAEFYLLENVSHSCCWQAQWPQILQRLADSLLTR